MGSMFSSHLSILYVFLLLGYKQIHKTVYFEAWGFSVTCFKFA